jgi:hypothetical protein
VSISDHPDLVSALLAVDGVAGAAVESDEQGSGPGTLRLQLQAGADEVSVAAQVNRLLRTRFGLAVDAGRVRVFDRPAQQGDGTAYDAELDRAGAPDDADGADEGDDADGADGANEADGTDEADGPDSSSPDAGREPEPGPSDADAGEADDEDPVPPPGRSSTVGTWPPAAAGPPSADAGREAAQHPSTEGSDATKDRGTEDRQTVEQDRSAEDRTDGSERPAKTRGPAQPRSGSGRPAKTRGPAQPRSGSGRPATSATLPFVRVSGPGRLSIQRVQMVTAGLGVEASVTLGLGDATYEGAADGVGTTPAVHRTVAAATLRALERVLDGRVRFDLEHLEVAPTGEDRTVLTVVTLVSDRGDERLSGASVVREDARQAVIRAVLAAVNRRIEPMLDGA